MAVEPSCESAGGAVGIDEFLTAARELESVCATTAENVAVRLAVSNGVWAGDPNTVRAFSTVYSRHSDRVQLFDELEDVLPVDASSVPDGAGAMTADLLSHICATNSCSAFGTLRGSGSTQRFQLVQADGATRSVVRFACGVTAKAMRDPMEDWLTVYRSRDMRLAVLSIDDSSALLERASVEFGFRESRALRAGPKATRAFRTRVRPLSQADDWLLVATHRISHSHTEGLRCAFAAGDTWTRVRATILGELRKSRRAIATG